MLPVAEPSLLGNEEKYVLSALRSGWISSKGEFINRFENEFAKFCGTKYALSCNNGTSALHLALLALDLKEGEEVIVPSLTYVATANVVKYCNATPIFVDSEKESWNMNPIEIEKKISPKTKGIIVVHLYGIPNDMEKISEIAKKNNLWVVEDCAEAMGAKYNGQIVGSFGEIGCFSFFGNKIITSGEGGMCTTNRQDLKEKIATYRNQGMSADRRYWHPVVGYNYRMTNIQAAIGLAQLEQLDIFLKKRKEDEMSYRELLKEVPGIVFSPLPLKTEPVFWMHSILIPFRDRIAKYLDIKDIETRPLFLPINFLPPYKNQENYPTAEELSELGINLPSSVNLIKEDINRTCNYIREKSKELLDKKKYELNYPWLNPIDSKEITCGICNNLNEQETVSTFLLNKKMFEIKKCLQDELMYLSPQPGDEYCEKLYNHPTYYKGTEDMYGLSTDNSKSETIAKKRFEEIKKYVENTHSLLEIGCAQGHFLEEARNEGIDKIWGVEISVSAVEECQKKGLEVKQGDINNLNKLPLNSPFETIVLYSLLEHVNNPQKFLNDLQKIIAKKGILIIRVPNTPLTGPNLSLLDHFWHFTEKSIKKLLEMNNFKVEEVFPSGTFKGIQHEGNFDSMTIVARYLGEKESTINEKNENNIS